MKRSLCVQTISYEPHELRGNILKLVILDLILQKAGVAELADARDSKSRGIHFSCGFDPHLQHQTQRNFPTAN